MHTCVRIRVRVCVGTCELPEPSHACRKPSDSSVSVEPGFSLVNLEQLKLV